MEGIEKLRAEVLEINNSNITAIFNYLENRKDLYNTFNNNEKSTKQMYEYICNQAEKQKIGKVAMIADNVVLLWAVNYFLKSNKELGLIKETKKEKTPIEIDKKEINVDTIKKENENEQMSIFQEVNG